MAKNYLHRNLFHRITRTLPSSPCPSRPSTPARRVASAPSELHDPCLDSKII
ncbi:hypothetical protein HMPREF7215_2059 [Pyramidobacter piscolens W5455]|uniref:Uncharacterized protein n=1 Tax=Pyramidobacter piscolens W5455 TaxID=352165 RepID=A0ABM9ZXT9_9BACT|nr:hypothetical protein HMPREF7215_2059 [Pyramidobacter piscolens W5455]